MTLRSVLRRYQTVMVFRWLGVGAVASFVFILMQERGLSLGQIGSAVAVYGFTVAVLELPTGGLADSLGRRPVLAVASTITISGTLVLFIAESYPAFLVAWGLLGIGRALDSGALEAWFVDAALAQEADADLSTGLSRGEVAGAVALAVGSLLGGFAPTVLGIESTSGPLTELSIPILLASLAGAAHLASVLLLVHEPPRPRTESIAGAIREVPNVVAEAIGLARRHPGIRNLLVATLVIGVTASSVEVLWQPRFADLSGSADARLFGTVGAALFAAAAAGAALVPPVLGRLRGSRGAAGVVSHLGAGASLLTLAALGAVIPAAVALALLYVFVGIRGPIHNELLHRRVASTTRSTMLSADSLALQLGGFSAALMIPRLADAWSIPAVWSIIAVAVALAAALYPSASRSQEYRPEAPDAAGI